MSFALCGEMIYKSSQKCGSERTVKSRIKENALKKLNLKTLKGGEYKTRNKLF